MTVLLWCNDDGLRPLLGTPEVHLAVNVFAPPATGGLIVDETVDRMRALVEDRLMRVATLMRGQIARMGMQRGMVVNVLGRAVTPDALALAVDDGVVALTQVLQKKHPHLRLWCLLHGRVALPSSQLALVIQQRLTAWDVPFGNAPVVLDGGSDPF